MYSKVTYPSRVCLRVLPAVAGACALGLAGLMYGGPGRAQSAPQAAAESAGIEEIVVTATRRSESLSRVPISVTALSQDAMDERGIRDFQDIARFTPGVAVDNSGTNAISIRGISSSAGSGTTGIYLDDTPVQMRSLGFNPDDSLPKTFDLDRVEVLRGPQGTLFGAGSEGGTVRYILAPAKLNGSSTYARSELSISENGSPSYELGVAHGTALIEGTLGIRASAWFREDGGWINRVDPTSRARTDRNSNYADTFNLRVAAVWQPTSAIAITPSIMYQNGRKHDESTYWPAYSNPDKGQFNNATPERMPVPDEFVLPALKLEVSLAHSQIIANTSYYYRKEKSGYQGSVYDLAYYQSLGWVINPNTLGLPCGDTGLVPGAPVAPGSNVRNPACSWYPLIDATGIHLPAGFAGYATPNVITNHQMSWTQEVRWQSTDETSPWRWTIGAFWQLAKEGSIEELRDPQISQLFQYLYASDPLTIFGNYYSCNGVGTYTLIPRCDIYYNANTTTDRQIAIFGELGYALTDTLRLTVGERIARTTFELQHYSDGLENFGPRPASASQSETPNTPKVNLSYQRDNANLFYGTYAKGFRAPGGNAPLPSYCDTDLATAGFPNGAPLTYQSDSTNSYEIGAKNRIGPHLQIASSMYYIQWRNIQQNVYVAGACGLQFTGNLGNAVAKGVDLQVEIAAGGWKFDVAAGYTDARYTKRGCPPAGCGNGVPPYPLSNVGDAISGQGAIEYSPGLTPPWTTAIGAEYGFRVADHPAYVRLDWEYEARNNWPSVLQDGPGPNRTSQYNLGNALSATPGNTYTLPSTVFASLRAGVNVGNWALAAFVDNLFDSHTVTNYQLGQPDSYNRTESPAGSGTFVQTSPSVQQNAYTFRPRTMGITATLHM
jgi:iron complex outermembrane receptor protein